MKTTKKQILRNRIIKCACSLTIKTSNACISFDTFTNLTSLKSLRYRVSLIIRINFADYKAWGLTESSNESLLKNDIGTLLKISAKKYPHA